MFRFSLLAAAVMSFCVLSPILQAEDDIRVEITQGVVKSVDEEKAAFVLDNSGKEVAITTDKDTKYFDARGREAKMAEVVKKGAKVKVTHTNQKAIKIEA